MKREVFPSGQPPGAKGSSKNESPQLSSLEDKESSSYLINLFNSMDTNNDGRIDAIDVHRFLKSRGKKAFIPPPIPLEKQAAIDAGDCPVDCHDTKISLAAEILIHRLDADSSGDVTLKEFLNYALQHEEKLKDLFNKLDKNHDGFIQVEEIISVTTNEFGIQDVNHTNITEWLRERTGDETLTAVTWEQWRDMLMMSTVDTLPEIVSQWRHATYLDTGEDSTVPDDFSSREMQTGMWWRHLLAGGVAGAVSRTATAPLDRVKVFLQVHGSQVGRVSACFRSMLAEGGTKSLWRGNGINVLKIAPETALKFMAYEQGKKILKKKNAELNVRDRLFAGSIAGAFAQTVIYPMEVIKTRLALRKTGDEKSLIRLTQKIVTTQGVRILYRGYFMNLLGILPYAGIDLSVYETLKNKYIKRYHSTNLTPKTVIEGRTVPVGILLGCGTVSCLCGQIVSYPLALVRTRMQATNSEPAWMISNSIWAAEGLKGFYRGIGPNMCKVVPAVSISYVVYERVRGALGGNVVR